MDGEFHQAYRKASKSKGSATFVAAIGDLKTMLQMVLSWYPDGIVVQIQDITQRHEAARQAAAKEELLESIIDALPVGLIVKDSNFRNFKVNKKTLEQTGLTNEDYLKYSPSKPPPGFQEGTKEERTLDRRILSGAEKQISHPTRHTLPEGHIQHFLHRKVPLPGADGKPAGVITITMETTAQQQLLEALEHHNLNLLQAQEISETGSWEWSVLTGGFKWSEEVYRIFQLPADREWMSYENYLNCVHPEDREMVINAIDHTLDSRDNLDLEHRIVLPDDSIRHIHIKSVVQWDETGFPNCMFGVVQNVTRQKNIERDLRDSVTRLERSRRDLEMFASIAAHDLQEPLRKITAFGARLTSNSASSLDEKGMDYLNRILSAVERMRKFIDDLLSYSRITSRGQPFEPVALADTVKKAWEDLQVAAKKIGAELQIGDLPTVQADPVQMYQLFLNLLSNSLKYHNTEQTPVIKINQAPEAPEELHSHQSGDRKGFYRICVEDNGIGFENKYADQIFAIFHRLHGRNTYEGSGMGLALCRKIADRHEGSIFAYGHPTKGAVITLHLPRSNP